MTRTRHAAGRRLERAHSPSPAAVHLEQAPGIESVKAGGCSERRIPPTLLVARLRLRVLASKLLVSAWRGAPGKRQLMGRPCVRSEGSGRRAAGREASGGAGGTCPRGAGGVWPDCAGGGGIPPLVPSCKSVRGRGEGEDDTCAAPRMVLCSLRRFQLEFLRGGALMGCLAYAPLSLQRFSH